MKFRAIADDDDCKYYWDKISDGKTRFPLKLLNSIYCETPFPMGILGY